MQLYRLVALEIRELDCRTWKRWMMTDEFPFHGIPDPLEYDA